MTTETRALWLLAGIAIGILLGNRVTISTTKIVVREVGNVLDFAREAV